MLSFDAEDKMTGQSGGGEEEEEEEHHLCLALSRHSDISGSCFILVINYNFYYNNL